MQRGYTLLRGSCNQNELDFAAKAFEAAMDKSGVTPYSQAATEAFDMVYNGGKPDDITVVVTRLQ